MAITSLMKGFVGLCLLCLLSILLISAYLLYDYERRGADEEEVKNLISHMLLVRRRQIITPSQALSEPPPTEPLIRQNTSNFGFMMALSYSDQITGSVVNLLSLQCFAGALHPQIRLVEPFLDMSVLGIDATHREGCGKNRSDNHPTSVKLTDVFSAEHWFEASKEMAPLISWDDFIHTAGRQLIIVDRLCDESHTISDGAAFECTNIGADRFNHSVRVFQDCYGFEVVRKVYFTSKRTYSQSAFEKLIYGDFSPINVTVLFNMWGGIERGPYRIQVIGAKGIYQCKRYRFFDRSNVPYSQQLKEDALKYKEKYITKDKRMESYISVMVRLEFLHFNKLRRKSPKVIRSVANHVYNNIMKQVEVFRAERKIHNVFLTMDCREQGSSYFNNNVTAFDAEDWRTRKLVAASISDLYEMLYGNTSSLTEWDNSFYDVSSIRNPGYIGQLQKYLAANSTCLITMGGGSFQATARVMFRHSHSGDDKRCFHDIELF